MLQRAVRCPKSRAKMLYALCDKLVVKGMLSTIAAAMDEGEGDTSGIEPKVAEAADVRGVGPDPVSVPFTELQKAGTLSPPLSRYLC